MCTSDRPESRVPSPESSVAGLRPSGLRTQHSGLSTQDSGLSQAGLTLVELVIFIVVVSVGVAGILSVMNLTTSHSADPLVRKQALAIAEALLEEIELQPWTYCDPDDANAATATSAADCAGGAGAEARGTFDQVTDYNGFAMNGITSLADGNAIPGLEKYAAAVTVANPGGGADPSLTVDASHTLRITVTVTGPGNTTVVLDGYRTFYAPRT